jgi:hypothetical protein
VALTGGAVAVTVGVGEGVIVEIGGVLVGEGVSVAISGHGISK